MSFPVIIIFLVLCLWFIICLPLLTSSYSNGDLVDDYDTVILLSLCASMMMTFIIVTYFQLCYYVYNVNCFGGKQVMSKLKKLILVAIVLFFMVPIFMLLYSTLLFGNSFVEQQWISAILLAVFGVFLFMPVFLEVK